MLVIPPRLPGKMMEFAPTLAAAFQQVQATHTQHMLAARMALLYLLTAT
jgi:hypothetical protein